MTQWTPILMMTAINYLKTPSVSTFYAHTQPICCDSHCYG